MNPTFEHPGEVEKTSQPLPVGPEQAGLVLQELDRIVASRFFKNAERCRQFLEYVVRQKLDGHAEQLKERTIGTGVFGRDPSYATGEDPVVRVQAVEVRRRLHEYYQALPHPPVVLIELKAGSYSPIFHWTLAGPDAAPKSDELSLPKQSPMRSRAVPAMIVGVLLVLVAASGLIYSHSRKSPGTPASTVSEKFWAPAFATPQPVLICLAKPVVYRPSFNLYQRYAKSHPGSFQTEVERSNQVLPLDANETIPWREFVPYSDYGVAVGDAYAAVRLSSLLGQIGKPSQVRIGGNYSFEDLSNSPSVIVGAFNNKWTMQILSGLHFSFVEDHGLYMIREQIPGGRVWRATISQTQEAGDDFAIVARLFDSKTGQFTIIAAGILGSGTQAAGEFISNPDFLERGLRSVSPDWQKKNTELVLHTTNTDSVPGPPQVIASYVW